MFDAEELSNETLVWVREEELPQGVSHVDLVRLLAGELSGLTGWRRRTLVNTALDREAQDSTYLGYGLAIPHARVFEIPSLPCTLPAAPLGWIGRVLRLALCSWWWCPRNAPSGTCSCSAALYAGARRAGSPRTRW